MPLRIVIEPAAGEDPRTATLLALGYHPAEIVASRLPLYPHDLAWHLDLVRCEAGLLVDAAPAVTSEDTAELLRRLKAHLQLPGFGYHVCRGPAGLLTYDGGWPFDLKTTDPAGHVGLPEAEGRPRGAGDEVMREIIETSQSVFADAATKVTQVWIWGSVPPGSLRPLTETVAVVTTNANVAETARAAGVLVDGPA